MRGLRLETVGPLTILTGMVNIDTASKQRTCVHTNQGTFREHSVLLDFQIMLQRLQADGDLVGSLRSWLDTSG